MPSGISGAVPATNAPLTSAEIRTEFAIAASEITALQTKTTVSGDGGLAVNGQLTVTALQGRAVAATAPGANQVLAWSGSQWTPATVSPGTGGGGAAIGDTPPASPTPGDLWWDSVGGQLYVRYNDGSSAQWVVANAGGGGGGGGPASWGSITGTLSAQADLNTARNAKQNTLVSGTTIKTINGTTLLGSGDLAITGTGGGGLPLTGGTLASDSAPTVVTMDNAGGTYVPQLQFRSSNGTLVVPTTITGNIQLGMLQWFGWNGSAYSGGANIQAMSAAGVTWTTGNAPTRLIFQTTKTGSGSVSDTMYIGPSGGLVIGSPAGADRGAGSINSVNAQVQTTLSVLGTIELGGEAIMVAPAGSIPAGARVLYLP